ncbi:hypothetical protein CK203_059579 [Vitis vinifera]|uniref:Uncharacterized protein n=1 Tax=Vitis vinifera TaxID=29760 RepID=A0A438GAG3_VITVI|nr:hypothetical protein CK203_059579 [Vitis vinifera]
MSRQCMCGGDDHLAWKRPVSSEVCRGLRTIGGILPHMWVHMRAFRASLVTVWIQCFLFGFQLRVFRDRADSHQSSDSSVEMSDELASIFAYIRSSWQGQRKFFHLGLHIAFHSICQIIEAKVERLESRTRQIRLQDRGLTWDDRDGIPTTSLPAKFRMPDIERYSGIGCPKIHLRLYSTVMRVHEIDDAQLTRFGGHQIEAKRVYFFISQSLEGKGGWILGVWFRQLLVLRRPLLEDYGQILFLFLTTSMQSRPPHPRTTTPLPSRPYAQRPTRQFTPLGMTLTRAFEKLRDTDGHDTEHCAALHHAIQDLIDSKLVNLSGPSVTTNPLPTHSTHAVPLPSSLH